MKNIITYRFDIFKIFNNCYLFRLLFSIRINIDVHFFFYHHKSNGLKVYQRKNLLLNFLSLFIEKQLLC